MPQRISWITHLICWSKEKASFCCSCRPTSSFLCLFCTHRGSTRRPSCWQPGKHNSPSWQGPLRCDLWRSFKTGLDRSPNRAIFLTSSSPLSWTSPFVSNSLPQTSPPTIFSSLVPPPTSPVLSSSPQLLVHCSPVIFSSFRVISSTQHLQWPL